MTLGEKDYADIVMNVLNKTFHMYFLLNSLWSHMCMCVTDLGYHR